MPRVTVITATYNWATVLPYSIMSVLDQTFTDFELLVIGDGCTDESAAVVSSFADPRVHWYNLPDNVGHQYAPNNEGIHRANGDVIAYLGHDDLWLPRHLELLVAGIEDGAPIVHGTWLIVSPGEPPSRPGRASWVYEPGVWIPPTALAHDRGLALSVGGWRPPIDTGVLDPEADLVQRMVELAQAPHWVQRLTCVKFPAALRANVYLDRPHHEQAAWLQEIRHLEHPEDAFERLYPELREPPRSRTQLVVKRVQTKVALRSRLRKAGLLDPAAPPESAEERRLRRRPFKGLGSGS